MKNQMITTILGEINQVIDGVEESQLTALVDILAQDKRIFVLGEGRSGLQGKGFAMRLMHIGREVYVIGETITPSIQPGDVLVAISGSGATKTGDGLHSIQLLSSLFDQTLHIVLDYVCLDLSQKLAISNERAKAQHSNME